MVAKREIVFSGPDSGGCVCVCGVYFSCLHVYILSLLLNTINLGFVTRKAGTLASFHW